MLVIYQILHFKNSKINNYTNSENKKIEKKDVKINSYFNNIYKKKNKKYETINYSNNLFKFSDSFR